MIFPGETKDFEYTQRNRCLYWIAAMGFRKEIFLPAFFLFLFSFNTLASEQPEIPEVLKPWIPWVLKGEEKTQCPFISSGGLPIQKPDQVLQHVCAWPGQLTLGVNDRGATFKQKWQVFTKTQVFLPSGQDTWPEGILDNGLAIPVLEVNQKPAIWLSTGEHLIEGLLRWVRRPQSLSLPEQTGLVSLTDNGVLISFPDRTETEVWLEGKKEAAPQIRAASSLQVQVYRKVKDGIPITLTTRVKLDVSGEPREEVLGKLLLSNFIPMQLTSSLPSRIEPDGRVRVQLRPGTWDLTLVARQKNPALQIAFEKSEGAWSAHEVWSYEADNRLRVTEVKAGELIDPKQAGVPAEWQNLPSWKMNSNDTLVLTEKMRGIGESLVQLTLNRDWWLDFKGDGFTVKDKITGKLETPIRLDMKRPYELKQVSIGGEQLPITQGEKADESGVEVRKTHLDLEGIARINKAPNALLSVTGWQQDFKYVKGNLHLPPGTHLFTAFGVDKAAGAWLDRWTLLDCFLVLFTALVISKLLNRTWGLITLVMLALFYHEEGMRITVWLNMLAALALMTYLPAGKFKKIMVGYGVLSFIAILIVALPFSAKQVRLGLYPQLEHPMPLPFVFTPSMDSGAGAMAPEAKAIRGETFAAAYEQRAVVPKWAQSQIVQNSPYLPGWRWNEYSLSWNGAVAENQTMRLLVIPRWLTTSLRLLGVLFLLGLVARLGLSIFRGIPLSTMRFQASTVSVLLCLSLFGVNAIHQKVVAGEIPTPEMLQELKKRLIEPPECAPTCVAISSATVELQDDLTIRLKLASDAQSAVAIPGGIKEWLPQHAGFEGKVSKGGVSLPVSFLNGSLWVFVDKGVHELILRGPLPSGQSFQLPFPMKPANITVSAPNWEVSGIALGKLLSDRLSFNRKETLVTQPTKTPLLFQKAPAFVEVERILSFESEWRVHTTVQRLGLNQEAIYLEVPLLPGESAVTPENLKVEDNKVIVSLSEKQERFTWDSVLKEQPRFTLIAAKTDDWTETWRFQANPEWHLDFKGIPPVLSNAPWLSIENEYQFMPWPGETLTVSLFRPKPLEGGTLTIENLKFESIPAKTSTQLALHFTYRSTMGGHHQLNWPEALILQEVKIEDEIVPLKAHKGVFLLPVLPGMHRVELNWQQNEGISWVTSFPSIQLNAPSNNAEVSLKVPDSRWIWFTGGPRLGPAVLYWGELVLFLVIAVALARTRYTPLKMYDWVLLGLGVSMTSWWAFLLGAIWLFSLAYRGRMDVSGAWLFNTRQILLAILTCLVLVKFVEVIPRGLLGSPDMHIVGNGSTALELHWFSDYQEKSLPTPWVISLPLWVYRTAMLLWSLWFAFALLTWLKWGWGCVSRGGLWRRKSTLTAP